MVTPLDVVDCSINVFYKALNSQMHFKDASILNPMQCNNNDLRHLLNNISLFRRVKKAWGWRLSPLLHRCHRMNRRIQTLKRKTFQINLKGSLLPLQGMTSIYSLISKNRNYSFFFFFKWNWKKKTALNLSLNQNASGIAARCTDVTHHWSWELLIRNIPTGHQCSCTVKCRIKLKVTPKRTGKDGRWTKGPSTARALRQRHNWKKTWWPI